MAVRYCWCLDERAVFDWSGHCRMGKRCADRLRILVGHVLGNKDGDDIRLTLYCM